MPFEPIPGSRPLSFPAAIAPPTLYFFALVLLPPFNHLSLPAQRFIKITKLLLALSAAILFARLPLFYHIPWSCGLTYILSLVGWYGCTRVLDVFLITARYRIPRRVKRKLKRLEDPESDTDNEGVVQPLPDGRDRDVNGPHTRYHTRRSSLLSKFSTEGRIGMSDIRDAIVDNNPLARKRQGALSIEKATTDSHEHMKPDWLGRFLYALDLETSMRGVGWNWTTADVRHSRKTWLPTLEDEFYQLFLSDIPTVIGSLALERYIYRCSNPKVGIDTLNLAQRALLTLSQGVFLFGTFSTGYTAGAILTAPLRKRYREWTTHNLAFWPPLNSAPLTSVTTVRQFWSRSWHRLFSRLFLVWGVWPGQWLERTLVPGALVKRYDPELDLGKVLGAFFTSGIVHAAAGIAINGGHPSQTFEWLFFWCSGIAIVIEEAVQRMAYSMRDVKSRHHWYDPWIGRAWTITVLLWSGQYFTRGWYDSGLIGEMVTLPLQSASLALDILIRVLTFGKTYLDGLVIS